MSYPRLLSINTAREDMANYPPIATLFSEFAMMHLHVNFDSIQRFAGQFGESEARREYPRVRDWSLSKKLAPQSGTLGSFFALLDWSYLSSFAVLIS